MCRKRKDSLNKSKESKSLKSNFEKILSADFDIDLNEDDETMDERKIAEQREKRKALLEKLAAKEIENVFLPDNRYFNNN